MVAAAAASCAAWAEAGSVVSIVIDARAASGVASAVPVAATLTVRADAAPGAMTVVFGAQAERTSVAATTPDARTTSDRRVMDQ
ncbi:unannotated protein [freshwater metagenome]|uniref:Unannotated protein n=1 Tax=freshwater metagenome TaxID=449393 RepID=A0A6J7QFS0_9ZZZZ